MADKLNKRSLAREGELSQKTEKRPESPVPKAGEFFGLLKKPSLR